MFRFVVFFCAVALVAGETSQVYRQCANSAAPLPLSASIEGCIRAPCVLPQLDDVTLAINFATPNAVESMRTLTTAFYNFGGMSLPIAYSLEEKAATCNFLTNGQCPTQPGQNLEYVIQMFVAPYFPVGTQVDMEFSIVDEQNNPLACLRVPIRITSPDFGKSDAA